MTTESENEAAVSVADLAAPVAAVCVLSVVWGMIQYRDGTPWLGAALAPPLALGMLSAATVRLALGRHRGDFIVVTLGGVAVFVLALGLASGVAYFQAGEAPFVAAHVLLSFGLGMVGAAGGSLALMHYRARGEGAEQGDGDWSREGEAAIDYSTEPARLVCLITNQAVKPKTDEYVVCHNSLNVSSTCHAVYLMEHVHVLGGRCNSCYKPFLKRDLRGMRRRRRD